MVDQKIKDSWSGYVIYKNNEEIFAGCAPLGHATNNYANIKL